MAKYFTAKKVGFYLLTIIIVQPIAFSVFELDSSFPLEIISHSIFIIIGLIFIFLNFHFDKRNNKNKQQ